MVRMLRIIMISVLFVLAPETTNGGYIYPRPNITLQLPKTESITLRPIIESGVSYSVPFQSYQELHQDNSNLVTVNYIHESKVNSDLTIPCLANQQHNLEINPVLHHNIPAIPIPPLKLITPLKNQESNVAENNGQHLNIPVANIPIYQNNYLISETYSHVDNPSIPTANLPQPLKEQSTFEVNTVHDTSDIIANSIPNVNLLATTEFQNNLELNNVQHVDIPSLNIPTGNVPASAQLQSNFEFTTQQHIIQQDNNGGLNSPINVQEAMSPKIFKHVYFHAPPPEIEEPSVRKIPPKIKNVKIIVIQVPSQENKNIDLSQRNAINQFAPVEEKTIIYVLSEKPTTPQVFVPEPVPSEHEVIFVKYKGSIDSAVTQISDNDNLEQIDS